MSALTMDDLVQGLERYPQDFGAIDVYAADVRELRDAGNTVPSAWKPVAVNQFEVSTSSGPYVAEFKPELGVLRLRRDAASSASTVAPVQDDGVDALFSKKPEAVLDGTIVGMLVSRTLTPGGARQVLTMQFSRTQREWRVYSGALSPTMKRSLGMTPA